MNTTSPRPASETPSPAPVEAPTRALDRDRQLPGISWEADRHRHHIPAGTLPQPGSTTHYRASCGAVCLLMPPPRANWEYAYESLPLHADCQPDETPAP